ncbi:increased DNA methylation 1-like [Fagus crenata]
MEKKTPGLCPSPSSVVFVESKWCPGAVSEWYKLGQNEGFNCYKSGSSKKDVKENAKKHLSAMGWVIWYGQKGSKRELRYNSPLGKCFYSLRMACKGCLDLQESGAQSGSSTDQRVVSNSVSKTDSLASNSSCQRVVSDSVCESVASDSVCESVASDSVCEKVAPCCEPMKFSNVGDEVKGELGADNHKRKRRKVMAVLEEKFGHLRGESMECINVGDEVNVELATGNLKRRRGGKVLENLEKTKDHSGGGAMECINVGDKDKGELATGNLKRKRGKVWADLEKTIDHSKGAKTSRVLNSRRIVRNAVIPSSSNRSPRSILSWLLDNNVVLPRAIVHYRGKKGGPPLLTKGYITRDGIECDCCSKVFALTAFEAHAGSTNHRPAANILLEDGRSLIECQKDAMNGNENKCFTTDQQVNDEICSVCHYGGDLILCDQCPSSFHKGCLGLEDVPVGDWFCPSCRCGICDHGKFQEGNGNNMDNCFMACKLCEHKFHFGCLRSREVVNSEIYDKDHWFCGRKCEDIFLGLRKLLGKPIPVGDDNLTWTVLKYDSESCNLDASDIEASTENYSKLSAALSVMHECFDPVKDPHTNRDLVEDVIFSRGSELKRLNFRGFYTVLLERNEELITVATLRIHGEKVAEVPLVGTRFQYRRLGMCQILMNELEKQLMVLGVGKLILPAAPSVLKTWTTSFMFSEMTNFERSQLLDYAFLDFQDTIMCQKLLMKNTGAEIVDEGLVDAAASHGESNSECFIEEANFQKANRGNSTVYSKCYKRRKISACERQSSGYSITTRGERYRALRPQFKARVPFHDAHSRHLVPAI